MVHRRGTMKGLWSVIPLSLFLFFPLTLRAQSLPLRSSNAAIVSTSPVIESVTPEGDPILPFFTNGDLWLSTWADDDNVYSGWGDGLGISLQATPTDCGIARFSGTFPTITATEQCHVAPTALPTVNDKPSSLLYVDKRLYGLFHSPLGDAWIGYLAYSDDYGKSWSRVGFYQEGETPPANASPWTRDRGSKFRCAFFINMGKSYSLNSDGYVYALAIGTEWSWQGSTFLMRVKKENILVYGSWEYLSAIVGDQPRWSSSQSDAIPLSNVTTPEQGSAMYHPGIKRYLFLTSAYLYDAPTPWGPWTVTGPWVTKTSPVQWQGGYQPGIISKDAGLDFFWFTIAGQNQSPMITYRLNLGKMKMKLRSTGAEEQNSVPRVILLSQNFPNPFNPSTTIQYFLPSPTHVTLTVYNTLGQVVKRLVDEGQNVGTHEVRWNTNVPGGMYFYRLQTGLPSTGSARSFIETKKMLLLK